MIFPELDNLIECIREQSVLWLCLGGGVLALFLLLFVGWAVLQTIEAMDSVEASIQQRTPHKKERKERKPG